MERHGDQLVADGRVAIPAAVQGNVEVHEERVELRVERRRVRLEREEWCYGLARAVRVVEGRVGRLDELLADSELTHRIGITIVEIG